MINRKRNGGFGDLVTVCTTEEGKIYGLCSLDPNAYKNLPDKKLISTSHVYYLNGSRNVSKELRYYWTY